MSGTALFEQPQQLYSVRTVLRYRGYDFAPDHFYQTRGGVSLTQGLTLYRGNLGSDKYFAVKFVTARPRSYVVSGTVRIGLRVQCCLRGCLKVGCWVDIELVEQRVSDK